MCIQTTLLLIHQIAVIRVQNMQYWKHKMRLYNSLAKQLLIMIVHYIFPKVQEWTLLTKFNVLFDIGSTECGPMPSDSRKIRCSQLMDTWEKFFAFSPPKQYLPGSFWQRQWQKLILQGNIQFPQLQDHPFFPWHPNSFETHIPTSSTTEMSLANNRLFHCVVLIHSKHCSSCTLNEAGSCGKTKNEVM